MRDKVTFYSEKEKQRSQENSLVYIQENIWIVFG